VSALRLELGKSAADRERIVGASRPMLEIFKLIGKVASSDATVLITGESGTGKELVAEALHRASVRNPHPLVKVSCAALPETLLETELFGHEKGSFTGAMAMRKGRFETANQGTIFLDEIGEMTLATQTKLLRILQEREFERIGSNTPIKIDIRVITATNRDLVAEVEAGRFREDLYYRLNVIHIDMPPLRERRDDIPALVEHFLVKYRYAPGAIPTTISEEALAQLVEHDWPGNVRELENAIERAVVLSRGNPITVQHLAFTEPPGSAANGNGKGGAGGRGRFKDEVSALERQLIIEALEQADGNRTKAAKDLGIYRRLLYDKIREYGLEE
jgi:two-component system response regulator AtoC